MATLSLDQKQIERVKGSAYDIAEGIQKHIDSHSSVSVERTVLRLYGVDGTTEDGTPLPNKIVDQIQEEEGLGKGVSAFFSKAMLLSGRDAQVTAELLSQGQLDVKTNVSISIDAIKTKGMCHSSSERAMQLVSLFKYLHLYLFSPGILCKSLGRGVPLGHQNPQAVLDNDQLDVSTLVQT